MDKISLGNSGVSENIQAMHILNDSLFTDDTAESPVLEELILLRLYIPMRIMKSVYSGHA